MAIWPFWPHRQLCPQGLYFWFCQRNSIASTNSNSLFSPQATPSFSFFFSTNRPIRSILPHTHTHSHTHRGNSHTHRQLSPQLSLTHTHSLSLSLCFTHTRSLILLCFSFSKQGGDEKPRNRWWREQQVASMAESFARRELLWKMQVAPCMPP